MLRQKKALHASEIIEDGFCVNQNAVKRNMEARNNYLFRKKEKKSRDERQTKYHRQPQ